MTNTVQNPAANVAVPRSSRLGLVLIAANIIFCTLLYLLSPRSLHSFLAFGFLLLISAGMLAALMIRNSHRSSSSDGISQAMAASERLAEIGSIAAAVAHEIRNPLSALDIHAQLLEENLPVTGTSDQPRKHLDIIRSETHRLNLIVENFIRFARHRKSDVRPVQVGEHLANVRRLIESEAKERNIEIDDSELHYDLPSALADGNQIEQAFLNVVINAVQSMPQGGKLKLTTRSRGNFVECVISNTGPEIPAETFGRIFDLYFTTKEGGSGLGLPIAQKILNQQNGYITADTTPAETSFTLGLPITKPTD